MEAFASYNQIDTGTSSKSRFVRCYTAGHIVSKRGELLARNLPPTPRPGLGVAGCRPGPQPGAQEISEAKFSYILFGSDPCSQLVRPPHGHSSFFKFATAGRGRRRPQFKLPRLSSTTGLRTLLAFEHIKIIPVSAGPGPTQAGSLATESDSATRDPLGRAADGDGRRLAGPGLVT